MIPHVKNSIRRHHKKRHTDTSSYCILLSSQTVRLIKNFDYTYFINILILIYYNVRKKYLTVNYFTHDVINLNSRDSFCSHLLRLKPSQTDIKKPIGGNSNEIKKEKGKKKREEGERERKKNN